MKNRRYDGSIWQAVLAAAIIAIAAGAASAADRAAQRECAAPANATGSADSLGALRPTFRLLADDYDRKADEYASEAERDRTWASAEDMFDGGAYGRRYAAIFFADEAAALDAKAAANRALAVKYRELAGSAEARSGC